MATQFGLSDWVGQMSGQNITWNISWPGVIEDTRFVGISFFSDFVDSMLERVSESFGSDSKENPFVVEVVRVTQTLGNIPTGVPFRFAVLVAS
jgi:hypothetical protein